MVIYATGGTDSLSGLITDCVIENNGGGFESHVANNTLRRCVIRNNDSGVGTGGGLVIGIGTNYLYNCLIHNNLSGSIGGAIYKYNAVGPLYIHNCTIVSNKSTNNFGPGGIRSQAINPICNSIVRFNYQNALIDDWYTFGGTTFTNSNTTLHSTYARAEAGNINTDPKFVGLEGFDFRLRRDSPCVNAGTNLTWMVGASDLDGNPRIDRTGPGIVDMGCYEFVYQGSWILIR